MAEEPTLGELARLIGDMRQDQRDDFAAVNARLDGYVLREVFLTTLASLEQRMAAEKVAFEVRMSRMERDAESARASVRNAVLGSIGAVVASLISGVVMAYVLKG